MSVPSERRKSPRRFHDARLNGRVQAVSGPRLAKSNTTYSGSPSKNSDFPRWTVSCSCDFGATALLQPMDQRTAHSKRGARILPEIVTLLLAGQHPSLQRRQSPAHRAIVNAIAHPYDDPTENPWIGSEKGPHFAPQRLREPLHDLLLATRVDFLRQRDPGVHAAVLLI